MNAKRTLFRTSRDPWVVRGMTSLAGSGMEATLRFDSNPCDVLLAAPLEIRN